MTTLTLAQLQAQTVKLSDELSKANARVAELEEVLGSVQQEFRRHGNNFPDGFDFRTARFVDDVMAGVQTGARPNQGPNTKSVGKSWAAQRYADILKQADERYGKGWEHLSADQRDNFIAARLLYLVLGQDGAQFKAAQDMVQSVHAIQNNVGAAA